MNRVVGAARITPTVMLLVDGSSSMEANQYPSVTSGTSRWTALRTALLDPTKGVVPALQSLVKFGLAVYGTGTGDIFTMPPDLSMCPFPQPVVMPALDNLANVMAGIGDRPPGTFTPTGLALDAVAGMLPDGQSPDPDVIVEPQIIVLATDGNPNGCTPPQSTSEPPNFQPSLDAAMKAAAKHQKLFVISVGTDAEAMHLQQVANLGAGLAIDAAPGATVFYPEDTDELTTTLSDLIEQGVGCVVTLDAGIVQGKECDGSVTLAGAALECNGADGWRLNDAQHIELLGSACEAFKADAAVQLQTSFPCDALVN